MEEKGQTIINVNGDYVQSKHVDYEVGNVAKGGIGIQIVNNGIPADNASAEDADLPAPQEQPLPAEQPTDELADGTFDLHLQLLKDAMIKVQEIPYSETKYEPAIFHSYHWLPALLLGKDLGLLTGYDDLMALMKGNMKHVPNNQQNLSKYSKYIVADIYPDWKQPDKASEPYFQRFKFIADRIYKLYCIGCQREKIKPRGSNQ